MITWACVVCELADPWLLQDAFGRYFCVPCATLLLEQQGRPIASAISGGAQPPARRRRTR